MDKARSLCSSRYSYIHTDFNTDAEIDLWNMSCLTQGGWLKNEELNWKLVRCKPQCSKGYPTSSLF